LESAGLSVVELRTVRGEGGIGRDRLVPSFAWLTETDLETSGAYILARGGQ
jgi:hypothetical protein